MATLAEVQADAATLNEADQKKLVAGLEQPAGDTGRIIIWVILLVIMGGVIFFFGYLGYLRVKVDKDGAVLFALATTALGAVAGLLAPSPVSK